MAIFIFRPDLCDLVFVAFAVLLSTAGMFVLLKVEEINRKKIVGEKCEDASDLVQVESLGI